MSAARGYEPRWDIDSAAGYAAEDFVRDVREAFQAGSIEVKNDRAAFDTRCVYIEYRCRRTGDDYYSPSGIQTTRSDMWAVVLGSVIVAAPTKAVLGVACRSARNPDRRRECRVGSHPTKGVSIPLGVLLGELLDAHNDLQLDRIGMDVFPPRSAKP